MSQMSIFKHFVRVGVLFEGDFSLCVSLIHVHQRNKDVHNHMHSLSETPHVCCFRDKFAGGVAASQSVNCRRDFNNIGTHFFY